MEDVANLLISLGMKSGANVHAGLIISQCSKGTMLQLHVSVWRVGSLFQEELERN